MASIWGLIALRLADEEFLPFDYLSYASELQVYINAELDVVILTFEKFNSLQQVVGNMDR